MAKPWAQPIEEEAVATDTPDMTATPVATGPVAPQPTNGIAPVDRADQLRVANVDLSPGTIYVVGSHGGSGESTLASLSPLFTEMHGAWPTGPLGIPVILAARTHYHGIAAAGAAVRHWASGEIPGVELVGLVWMPDGRSRVPKELRREISILSGAVAHTWTLPWVEDWRASPPDPERLPKEAVKLIDEAQRLITEGRNHND